MVPFWESKPSQTFFFFFTLNKLPFMFVLNFMHVFMVACGLSQVAVHGLLTAVAALVGEHRR